MINYSVLNIDIECILPEKKLQNICIIKNNNKLQYMPHPSFPSPTS
jgi:hypothetical protein